MLRAGVSVSTYYRPALVGRRHRAATTPFGHRGRSDSKTEPFYEYRAKRISLFAWAKERGINIEPHLQPVNRGLSFAEAIEHKFNGRLPKRR
jgi:hypothetical protein